METVPLADLDAETCFRARAACGSREEGLRLLDELDRTGAGLQGCILRHMARLQVHLPDDLYEQVKARGLPASELLQKAVRAELRRQELLAETDRYLVDLIAEVGPPTAPQRTRAAAIARRIARRPKQQAG